jgi:hypothetical protein
LHLLRGCERITSAFGRGRIPHQFTLTAFGSQGPVTGAVHIELGATLSVGVPPHPLCWEVILLRPLGLLVVSRHR